MNMDDDHTVDQQLGECQVTWACKVEERSSFGLEANSTIHFLDEALHTACVGIVGVQESCI